MKLIQVNVASEIEMPQITELLSLLLESEGESTAEILGGVLGTLAILSVTVIIIVIVLILLKNHGKNQKWV